MKNTLVTILVFALGLSGFIGISQETLDSEGIANAITGNEILDISDPDIANDEITIENSMVQIGMLINTDQPPFGHFTYALDFRATPVLEDGTESTEITEFTLLVGQNTIDGNSSGTANVNTYILKNLTRLKLEVLQGRFQNIEEGTDVETNGFIPENVSVKVEFLSKKYAELNAVAMTPSHTYDEEHNELVVQWDAVTGAESYQLEWTWVDSYGVDFETSRPMDQIDFTGVDFANNNTRIETEKTTFHVPLIYSKGYVLYRVRAIGRYTDDPNKLFFGLWSSGYENEVKVSDWSNIYEIVEDHQLGKNWQFQASYAEEGKKKEVVSYFDGTLRNRQTVTKINSDDHVVVGEVIYDAQGRPAVEVLPVPTNQKNISYIKDFNLNAEGQIYDYQDFDTDVLNVLDEASDKSMSTVSGASKYYSGANDIEDDYQNRVPDAEGYPFSQIEYTPDNTGRISRKSGVGVTHQLGGDREMEYYYGTPEQIELNRLFGYSVGNHKHYKKNTVIDPNNQVSISYIDPQGRTIATALVGYRPPQLDGLPDEDDNATNPDGSPLHKSIKSDLLGKLNRNDVDTDSDNNIKRADQDFGALQNALTYGSSKVSARQEFRTFNYSLQNNEEFVISCNEENNTNVSYPFIYDLAISVKDVNGNSLLENPIVETINLADDQNNGVFELNEFQANVPRGSFQISKNLKVNKASVIQYANDFEARLKDPTDPCYIVPEEVSDLPPVTFDGCFVTCEECITELETQFTDRNNYAATQLANYDFSNLDYLTDAELDEERNRLTAFFEDQWDDLVAACNLPCADAVISDNSSEEEILAESISCSIGKFQLLEDMRPIGQYGAELGRLSNDDSTTSESTVPNNPKLNIYNKDNELYSTKVSNGVHNSWRNPRHYKYDTTQPTQGSLYTNGHYYNEDGSISYIKIKQIITEGTDSDGQSIEIITYEPELQEEAVIIEKPEDREFVYTEPFNLKDEDVFLSDGIWQDQWVESLLVYHPEYEYLKYAEASCLVTADVRGGTMNSDGYDLFLKTIQTYEDAVANQMFASFSSIGDMDPLFSAAVSLENSNAIQAKRALIEESLEENHAGSGKNLMEYTYFTFICGSINSCNVNFSSAAEVLAELNAPSVSEEDKNSFWTNYKANYFNAKQRVQTLFANIYASNRNSYNGCIGPDEPSVSLISTISSSSTSIKTSVNNLIQSGTQSICNDPNKTLYASKEMRFKPVDILYNSDDSPEEILNDIAELTNYEYFTETGVCPKARDLELFLNFLFIKHPDASLFGTRRFEGNYLTPDLFSELGGQFPPEPGQEVEISITNPSSNQAEIVFNQGGESIGEPITILIETPNYNWSQYGTAWEITRVKSIAASYDEAQPIFRYSLVAEVLNASDEYKEIILSGTTTARIAECSVTQANGIGEYLPNGGTNNSVCNKQYRFQNAFTKLLNELVVTNQINTNVDITALSSYENSYVSTFLGDGTAIWSLIDDSTYIIDVNGERKLTMVLPDPIDLTQIKRIGSVNFRYLKNRLGQITKQQVTINMLTSSTFGFGFNFVKGYMYESCNGDNQEEETRSFTSSGFTPGTCRLINFECCGDINDLVGEEDPEPFDCPERYNSCGENEAIENVFEDYMVQFFNYGLDNYSGNNSLISVQSQLASDFITDFDPKGRLEMALRDSGNSNNLLIDDARIYVQFSDTRDLRFKLLFGTNNPDYLVGFNMSYEYNIIDQWSNVKEVLCYDLVLAEGIYAPISLRTNSGEVYSMQTFGEQGEFDLAVFDSTSLSVVSTPNFNCDLFGEVEVVPVCETFDTVTINQFNGELLNLFNEILEDGRATRENIGKRINISRYTNYTSFLQQIFTYQTAYYADMNSGILIDPYRGAMDFSDVTDIFINIRLSTSTRTLFFEITKGTKYSFLFNFRNNLFFEPEAVSNLRFNSITFPSSGNTTNANNYTGDSSFIFDYSIGDENYRTSGFGHQRSLNSIESTRIPQIRLNFGCDIAIKYLNYPFQQGWDGNDIDVCVDSVLENQFERLIAEVIQETIISERENRRLDAAIFEELYLGEFKLKSRMEQTVNDVFDQNNWELPKGNDYYGTLEFQSIPFYGILERYNSRFTTNSNELPYTRLYYNIAFGLNEEFNDVADILDLKIRGINRGILLCAIQYVDIAGSIRNADNIRVNLGIGYVRENVSQSLDIDQSVCNLFSFSVEANTSSTRVLEKSISNNSKQTNEIIKDGIDPLDLKNFITIDGNSNIDIGIGIGISDSDLPCDPDFCIPPVIDPESCTDKYPVYLTIMQGISDKEEDASDFDPDAYGVIRDVVPEDLFCDNSLQYLVEDYKYYIEKFGVTSTFDVQYITINEFGSSEFNFGYPGMSESYEGRDPIIDLYYAHVNNNQSTPDQIMSWTGWTSNYLDQEGNETICVPRPFLFSTPTIELITPEETTCEQFVNAINDAYTRDTYESVIQNRREEFIKEYLHSAIDDAVENFDMEYFDKEYQYTLYYYDQAGNLLQTVPPEGVDRFTEAELLAEVNGVSLDKRIDTHRASNTTEENPNLLPNHDMITEYRYNSLNQLVWQKTPDGGITVFAYDDLGRIIASQNAKQKENNRFSYTTYDGLGRIVEAGEMAPDVAIRIQDKEGKLVYQDSGQPVEFEVEVPNPNAGIEGQPAFIKVVYPNHISQNRVEVTRTRYNNLLSSVASIFETVSDQEIYTSNTRNRVAAVFYYDTYILGTTKERQYDNAIYYAYDIHGNVNELVQHNTQMALTNDDATSGMKRIQYEYDLISGNVNQVTYQKGKPDQFIHKYSYDADNRIVNVQTSGDGFIWEQDASYKYFAHGPLARTELGERQVQGMDYAYTLQGWLKGVNSENLDPSADMGQDGTTGSTVAKDAMGFALSYYDGDYKSNQDSNTAKPFNNYTPNVASSLYNGNINQMVTSLLDNDESMLDLQRNVYQYDQLNRIKSMQGYNQDNTENYSSSYSYDNNGNLLTLNRDAVNNRGVVTPMDQLSYTYKQIEDPETGELKRSNQLDHVDDAINGSRFNDISSQRQGNYTYDAIGQLTSDEKEGITNIEWRVDGKVKQITKDDGTIIQFAYDGLGNRVSKTVLPENKTTLYTRDAQGNVLAVYEANTSGDVAQDMKVKEHHIYGSSRLGLQESEVAITTDTQNPTPDTYNNIVGDKRYELSNHLGNVLSVITDRKLLDIEGNGNGNGNGNNGNGNGNNGNGNNDNGGSGNNFTQTSLVTVYTQDFSEDMNAWSSTNKADAEISSGRLAVTTSKNNQGTDAVYTLEAGKTYQIDVYLDTAELSAGGVEVSVAQGGNQFVKEAVTETSTFSTTITTVDAGEYVLQTRYKVQGKKGGAQTYYVDDLVISEVVEDTTTDDVTENDFVNNNTGEYRFKPDVIAFNDYYPFGMLLPNRQGSSSDYRYGFNGMEKDDEIKTGQGNSYTSYWRSYDPRVGRFLSLDPELHKYSSWSPYTFSFNNPILYRDTEGDDPVAAIGEAILSFGLSVAMDYLEYRVLKQESHDVAMQNLNWKGAAYNAGETMVVSAVVSGWGTARFIRKIQKSKIGKIAIEVAGDIKDIMVDNYFKGDYDDENGDLDLGKMFDRKNMETLFYQVLVKKLVKFGYKKAAKALSRKILKAQKVYDKIDEKYDKSLKKFIKTTSKRKSKKLNNKLKKLDQKKQQAQKNIDGVNKQKELLDATLQGEFSPVAGFIDKAAENAGEKIQELREYLTDEAGKLIKIKLPPVIIKK